MKPSVCRVTYHKPQHRQLSSIVVAVLSLKNIHADAEGNDNENLNDEYVILTTSVMNQSN